MEFAGVNQSESRLLGFSFFGPLMSRYTNTDVRVYISKAKHSGSIVSAALTMEFRKGLSQPDTEFVSG